MILCEKCAESLKDFTDGMYIHCKTCKRKSFICHRAQLKEPCQNCAREKGICQVCGCDLKTEE